MPIYCLCVFVEQINNIYTLWDDKACPGEQDGFPKPPTYFSILLDSNTKFIDNHTDKLDFLDLDYINIPAQHIQAI